MNHENVYSVGDGGAASSQGQDQYPVPVIPGYRILRPIGSGGMGTVYQAAQLSMDRVVALKVFVSQQGPAKPEHKGTQRFVREAQSAGRVQSPYVVTVFDVGIADDHHFLAMEWVNGGDAQAAALAAGGRLPPMQALRIIRDAACGLEALYERGLIHRDIKPANILLDLDNGGAAKLGDLGLARHALADDRMTLTGAILGTPAYMSPEQAEGLADLDIRADIYALGATLFTLICGRAPFVGNSPWATVAAVLKDPLPDPRNFGCPDGIAELIEHCMVKDRGLRPQTPRLVISLIEDALRALASQAEILHVAANTPPNPITPPIGMTPAKPEGNQPPLAAVGDSDLMVVDGSAPDDSDCDPSLATEGGPSVLLPEGHKVIYQQGSLLVSAAVHGPHASAITFAMHGSSTIQTLPQLDTRVSAWLIRCPSPCRMTLDLSHYPRLISWDLGLLYKWYDTVVAHASTLQIAGLSIENLRKCQLVGLDVVMELSLIDAGIDLAND